MTTGVLALIGPIGLPELLIIFFILVLISAPSACRAWGGA